MTLGVHRRFDILVVGGGPAGIASAVRAAESGATVGIVDDNPELGGQIWRGSLGEAHPTDAAYWHERLRNSKITTLSGYRVFHQPSAEILLAEGNLGLFELRYGKAVLATGARERFLPFPGWTLPNVMGVGGLQAMVKSGLPIRGKRVIVAGSGPLLLAVASSLQRNGAKIPLICEQAVWGSLVRFSMSLVTIPKKIAQALKLRKELAGIPLAFGSWPTEAHGDGRLESVTISRDGRPETIPCDYLACGFHLVPNVELPILLGCEMKGGYIQVDEFQRTTIPGLYCAGEPTGIGGVESALVEGQIAGLAASGRFSDARELFSVRRRMRHFARNLDRAFRLRKELQQLPKPETLICRCEDVPYAKLQNHASWRSAKLHTRCGMGPCQGRICGPATEFLFGWKTESVRPPIFPARVEDLASELNQSQNVS